MSPLTPCPVPEIDRVLSSYVNTKQDAVRIRRALARHFASHFKSEKPTLNHLDYECPNDSATVILRNPSLKDTRLRYLHALEAKLKAQARHHELQVSLDELQLQHYSETSVQNDTGYDKEETRSYISLLRQRRRLAELQVVQASLEKLLGISPVNSHSDPKTMVQKGVGEQPDIPAERLEQLSTAQEDDTTIFKLKKEVLEAKAAMDRAQTAKTQAKSEAYPNPRLEQQVYALGCARDELVAWMEAELGKLSEDSVLLEDASPVKKWPQAQLPTGMEDAERHIRESYTRYTASRSDLINAHESMSATASVDQKSIVSRAELPNVSDPASKSKATGTISDILPHLPRLAQTARNERSLLQQVVYFQARIASADEELTEALSRLSDESHLLPSGPTGAVAWAKTAEEAGRTTKKFVEEQTRESQQEISRVSAIVELCSLQSKVLTSR